MRKDMVMRVTVGLDEVYEVWNRGEERALNYIHAPGSQELLPQEPLFYRNWAPNDLALPYLINSAFLSAINFK